uniref:Uncharacterized protein n=1 Tax=viral metagenome TaxID=1070528 RepID=A0A6H1ZJD6_9ZZZZ
MRINKMHDIRPPIKSTRTDTKDMYFINFEAQRIINLRLIDKTASIDKMLIFNYAKDNS